VTPIRTATAQNVVGETTAAGDAREPLRAAPIVNIESALKAHHDFLSGIGGGQQLTLDALTLPRLELTGLDLRDCRMVGTHMPGAVLHASDMSYSNLFGADFRGGDLSRTNFTRCDLRGVNLDFAKVEGAVLRFADLRDGFVMMRDNDGVLCVANSVTAGLEDLIEKPQGLESLEPFPDEFGEPGSRLLVKGHTSLKYANLSRADFRGSNLAGADLRGAILTGANLTDANLQSCILHGASLAGAVIDNTNLAKADLRGCDVELSDLTRANCPSLRLNADFRGLEGAFAETLDAHKRWLLSNGRDGACLQMDARDLSSLSLSERDFSAGRLRLARFSGASLENCVFALANLLWSVFAEAEVRRCDFRGADLSKAVLRGGLFEDCRFDHKDPPKIAEAARSARLPLVNLEDAVLERCSLAGCDLGRARLKGTVFRNCDLANANLKGADLRGAQFPGTNLSGTILASRSDSAA